MGISAKKGVYDFRRKFNSFNSGKGEDISLVDIIAYLNEGLQIWFQNRVSVAETNQKVRNDLRPWKETRVSLNLTKSEDYVKALYPKDIYHRLNQVASIKNDCCPPKEVIIRMVQSDDFYETLKNPLKSTDYYFDQLISTEDSKGLMIYAGPLIDVETVLIDYYRKPTELHAPTLDECGDDGSYYYDYMGRIIREDKDFESDNEFIFNEIIDVSVLLASRDVGDVQGTREQLQKILAIDSLYK